MSRQLVKNRTEVRGYDTNVKKSVGQGIFGGFQQKGDRVTVIVMDRGMGEPYDINPNGTLTDAPYIRLEFMGNHGWTPLTHSWLGVPTPALVLAKKRRRNHRHGRRR